MHVQAIILSCHNQRRWVNTICLPFCSKAAPAATRSGGPRDVLVSWRLREAGLVP